MSKAIPLEKAHLLNEPRITVGQWVTQRVRVATVDSHEFEGTLLDCDDAGSLLTRRPPRKVPDIFPRFPEGGPVGVGCPAILGRQSGGPHSTGRLIALQKRKRMGIKAKCWPNSLCLDRPRTPPSATTSAFSPTCSAFWTKSRKTGTWRRSRTSFARFSNGKSSTQSSVGSPELRRQRERIPELDIQSQLVTNTVIFKENLRLITGAVSGLTSRARVAGRTQKRPTHRNLPKELQGNVQGTLRGDQGTG